MEKSNQCSKNSKEDRYINTITKVIYQFFKSLFILVTIFILILIRKGLRENLTIVKTISYILIASLAMTTIFMVDNYVYNNLLLGLGIYFGFEIIKLV